MEVEFMFTHTGKWPPENNKAEKKRNWTNTPGYDGTGFLWETRG
jgi:hypothetical protein